MYTVGSIFQTTYATSKTMFPGNTLGQQQLQSGSGKRKKELREQMRLLNGSGNQVSGNHQNNAGNKVFVAQSAYSGSSDHAFRFELIRLSGCN